MVSNEKVHAAGESFQQRFSNFIEIYWNTESNIPKLFRGRTCFAIKIAGMNPITVETL